MEADAAEGAYKMLVTAYKWIQPKTDWKIQYDADGNYIGDYFEPQDYNRIKNNVSFLRDYVQYMFARHIDFVDLGEDVFYGSENEMKASWWTTLQDNLENINVDDLKIILEGRTSYSSNEAGRLLEELIRIESVCLNIYEKLTNIENNKPKLPFTLGSNLKGVRC